LIFFQYLRGFFINSHCVIIGSEGRNWKRIFIFCPSEPIIPQGYNWQWATNKIKFLSGGLFKKFIIFNNISFSFNNISIDIPSNANSESYANNQNSIENSLSNLSNNDLTNNDSELEQSKDDFSNQYKDILNDSFSSYADVFGLGGFASAPAPVTFSLFGKEYTVFNVQILNPYVENIRMIFLVFAYLLGIFILFRSV